MHRSCRFKLLQNKQADRTSNKSSHIIETENNEKFSSENIHDYFNLTHLATDEQTFSVTSAWASPNCQDMSSMASLKDDNTIVETSLEMLTGTWISEG